MGYVLLFLLQPAIHAVYFDSYQACINAGNQINISGQHVKFICAER